MRLIVCVGLIGSGKSTWAREYVRVHPGAVIVNRDALREMVFGEYCYDREYEPLIRLWARYAVFTALQEDRTVVVDETNLTRRKRAQWTRIAQVLNAEVRFVWFTAVEGNVGRRMASDARGQSRETWEKVFSGMKESFEAPDMYDEHVDGLECVDIPEEEEEKVSAEAQRGGEVARAQGRASEAAEML